jgi:ABC-type multidrug transport system fused ATPase/permease subunit
VPPRKSDGSFEGINKVFELVQVLSLPCLAFLFGFDFEISTYNLAQRSLDDASSNLLSITGQLHDLRTGVLPFSEDYTECLSLGSQTKNSKTAEVPDMNRLAFKSVYFSYDDMAPDHSPVECPDIDDTESTESDSDEDSDDDEDDDENDDEDDNEDDDSTWALKDFNFVFEAGKVYSIVGKMDPESQPWSAYSRSFVTRRSVRFLRMTLMSCL